MQTKQHQLINSLSHEMGTQIPVVEGAARIKLDGEDELWLEFPAGGQVLILHSVICSITSLGINYQQLESILALNSRMDVLRCGWLGFHKTSNSLRYFVTLPVQLVTAEILMSTVRSLTPIKEDVKKLLVLK